MKGKRRGNQFNIIAFSTTRDIFFMLIFSSGLEGFQFQNLHEPLDMKFCGEPRILEGDEVDSTIFGVFLIYLRVADEDRLFGPAIKM